MAEKSVLVLLFHLPEAGGEDVQRENGQHSGMGWGVWESQLMGYEPLL